MLRLFKGNDLTGRPIFLFFALWGEDGDLEIGEQVINPLEEVPDGDVDATHQFDRGVEGWLLTERLPVRIGRGALEEDEVSGREGIQGGREDGVGFFPGTIGQGCDVVNNRAQRLPCEPDGGEGGRGQACGEEEANVGDLRGQCRRGGSLGGLHRGAPCEGEGQEGTESSKDKRFHRISFRV